MSFDALLVSLEQIYYAFAERPDKLSRARPKEKTFAFVEKELEHLEREEIPCVHRPRTLNATTIQGEIISRK